MRTSEDLDAADSDALIVPISPLVEVAAAPAEATPEPVARALGAPGLLARSLPVLAGLVGACLAAYSLTRAGGLYGVVQYDDGVYFGAAVRLVSGHLPYRDFTFVQPPGIALWMAPLALVTHAAGTKIGLAWARVLTCAVVGVDAWLAGRIVRHRGALAAAVASFALAVYPAAFYADRTLLLEPYLVGLCLVATRLCFVGDEPAGWRRLLAGGLAFGAAGATKSWAALAVLALCVAFVGARPRRRFRALSRVAPLLGGTALGFAAVCGPFVLAAPRAFYHDVVVSQLARTDVLTTPAWRRLQVIVGLHGLPVKAGQALTEQVTLGLGVALTLAVGVPLVLRRSRTLERFALVATAAAVGALLVPAEFFDHYAYFAGAFLALSLGCAAARLEEMVRAVLARGWRPLRLAARLVVPVVLLAALVAGLSWIVPNEARFESSQTTGAGDPALAIDLAVPRGACAVSDAAILLVGADRLSADGRCPQLLDATALWLATAPRDAPSSCAPVDPALVARWRLDLSEADFFVESSSAAERVPWTVGLRAFFAASFTRVPDPGVLVYVRDDSRYAASALDPARWTRARLAAEGALPPPVAAGAARRAPPSPPACLAERT